jgi:polysaccharide deacetylase family protein (PEP-CTERM system associated)
LRVERNTHRLLDLLDSTPLNPTNPINFSKPKSTFFILGWIAQRLPNLVKEIHTRGHEIASHGFSHHLCTHQKSEELRNDLTESKSMLEDIIGGPVFGYRAPSFSITNDILKIIEESGYQYDSSYNSFALHGRYGKINLAGIARKGISYAISNNFFEIPISNLKIFGKIFPWGGGGYLRLFPFSLFLKGIEAILKKESAYLCYMHPWEIDPNQPRVKNIPKSFKFRHYINLNRTYLRLLQLIKRFQGCRFITLHDYIQQVEAQPGQSQDQ